MRVVRRNKIYSGKRDNSLDIARGVAVLAMILAHSMFFFGSSSFNISSTIQSIGDTVAFTLFLIVSGATSFILYSHKKASWGNYKPRAVNRIIQLIFSYYILAIVSNFQNFDFSSTAWIGQIIEIITFIKTPGFTEFLVNFIVYGSLFLLFPKFFEYIGKNIKISLLIGIGAYILGVIIYQIDLGSPLLEYKYLISGHQDIYRFPLLQYFGIYLIGFNFGYLLKIPENLKTKRKILFQYSLPIILFLVFTQFLNIETSEITAHLLDINRWPPSLPFLGLGILFSIYLFFVIIRDANRDKLNPIYELLIKFGKDALNFTILHLLFLQIFDKLTYGNNHTPFRNSDSIIYISIATIVLLFLTSYANDRFKFYSKKYFPNDRPSEDVKKSENIGQSIFIILILGSIFVGGLSSNSLIKSVVGYQKRTGDIQGIAYSKKEVEVDWWNYDYQYSRKLTLVNDAVYSEIAINTPIEFSVGFSELQKQNKINNDGSDFRLLYLSDGNFEELPYYLNISDNKAYIRFINKNLVAPGERDDNYYLYYGNRLAEKPTLENSLADVSIDLGRISKSSEKISALSINVDRVWSLIGENSGNQVNITLNINQDPFPQNQSISFKYEVEGTDLTGTLYREDDERYSGQINVDSLTPGIYQVQALAESNDKKVYSSKETIIVSYPIYVTWTMDWEGYDVKQQFLDDMTNISNTYNVPISHFWNARIYLASDISSSQSRYLTDWVKNRLDNNNDSLDMHIHMFNDMVTASGVDPITDSEGNPRPQWGSIQQQGYDVLMTSYNRDELNKILEWNLQQFELNSLPTPLGFRAGGWFADIENLQSIEDSGFSFDSSGRESFSWGSKKVINPWNLKSTTQPYRPSMSNQNSANPAPNFDIWEIPNNGADSYTFQTIDMTTRFDANFGDGIIKEKRAVTYLSHPHWFNIDKGKIEDLFEYISKHDFKDDRGPVVFTNVHEVYKAWAM